MADTQADTDTSPDLAGDNQESSLNLCESESHLFCLA